MLTPDFREGVEKTHTSHTKWWNRPLERNMKEEKKTPKQCHFFYMVNFCRFVKI
jgi:hypothetical protein